MTQILIRRAALAAFAATAFAAAPALAQDERPPTSRSAKAAASTSPSPARSSRTIASAASPQSDRDPPAPGLGRCLLSTASMPASGSPRSRATADTNVEADVYAGYAGEAGPVDYEVGAIAYLYPGGDGTGNVYEGTGSLAYTFGPATARLKANYAPDQENLAGDNFYLSAEARVGIPTTPFTLFAQVGRERGSFYGAQMGLVVRPRIHPRPVHRQPRLFRHRPRRRRPRASAATSAPARWSRSGSNFSRVARGQLLSRADARVPAVKA